LKLGEVPSDIVKTASFTAASVLNFAREHGYISVWWDLSGFIATAGIFVYILNVARTYSPYKPVHLPEKQHTYWCLATALLAATQYLAGYILLELAVFVFSKRLYYLALAPIGVILIFPLAIISLCLLRASGVLFTPAYKPYADLTGAAILLSFLYGMGGIAIVYIAAILSIMSMFFKRSIQKLHLPNPITIFSTCREIAKSERLLSDFLALHSRVVYEGWFETIFLSVAPFLFLNIRFIPIYPTVLNVTVLLLLILPCLYVYHIVSKALSGETAEINAYFVYAPLCILLPIVCIRPDALPLTRIIIAFTPPPYASIFTTGLVLAIIGYIQATQPMYMAKYYAQQYNSSKQGIYIRKIKGSAKYSAFGVAIIAISVLLVITGYFHTKVSLIALAALTAYIVPLLYLLLYFEVTDYRVWKSCVRYGVPLYRERPPRWLLFRATFIPAFLCLPFLPVLFGLAVLDIIAHPITFSMAFLLGAAATLLSDKQALKLSVRYRTPPLRKRDYLFIAAMLCIYATAFITLACIGYQTQYAAQEPHAAYIAIALTIDTVSAIFITSHLYNRSRFSATSS